MIVMSVQIDASGLCRADLGTASVGESPYGFPLTPGHEVAGVVAELGHGVSGWAEGDRVAVGWFGGSCGHCAACRRGDVVHCPQRQVPGVSYPGGWASSITVPGDAIVIGAGVAELVASNIAASPDHPDVRTSR